MKFNFQKISFFFCLLFIYLGLSKVKSLHLSLKEPKINLSEAEKSVELNCQTKKIHAKLDTKSEGKVYKDFPVVLQLSIKNLTIFFNNAPIKKIELESIDSINEKPEKNKNPLLCKEKCLELIIAKKNKQRKNNHYELEYFTVCLQNKWVKLYVINAIKKMKSCNYQYNHGKSSSEITYSNESFKNTTKMLVNAEIVNLLNTSKVLDKNVKGIDYDFEYLNKLKRSLLRRTNQNSGDEFNTIMSFNNTVVKAIQKIKDVIAEEELIKERTIKVFKQKLLAAKQESMKVNGNNELIEQIAKDNQKYRSSIAKKSMRQTHEEKEQKIIQSIIKRIRRTARHERNEIKENIQKLIEREKSKNTVKGRELLTQVSNIERKIPFDYRLCSNHRRIFINKTDYFKQLCGEIYSKDEVSIKDCQEEENFCSMCCDAHPFTSSIPPQRCESKCMNVLAHLRLKKSQCRRKIRRKHFHLMLKKVQTDSNEKVKGMQMIQKAEKLKADIKSRAPEQKEVKKSRTNEETKSSQAFKISSVNKTKEPNKTELRTLKAFKSNKDDNEFRKLFYKKYVVKD